MTDTNKTLTFSTAMNLADAKTPSTLVRRLTNHFSCKIKDLPPLADIMVVSEGEKPLPFTTFVGSTMASNCDEIVNITKKAMETKNSKPDKKVSKTGTADYCEHLSSYE